MKKWYQLTLSNSYKEGDNIILVIQFKPNEEIDLNLDKDLFNGKVWVDKENNRILKIELNIKDAKVHPFKPIGPNKILGVDMEITKRYQVRNEEACISDLDFNYDVFYESFEGHIFKARTNSYLRAFDFEQKFDLPNFDFTTLTHKDYRDITAVPYDSLFWKNTQEFRLFEHDKKIRDFLEANHIQQDLIKIDSNRYNTCLQYHYTNWSEKRFDIYQTNRKGFTLDDFKNINTVDVLEDPHQFNWKLYLDINEYNSEKDIQLFSILDPVDSYYNKVVTKEGRAFANMQFDLLEIAKRDLAQQIISSDKSREAIIQLYKNTLKSYKEEIKIFESETKLGLKESGMKKWNNYIYNRIGIDNLAVFKKK